MTKYVIGIDGGGSHSRLAAIDMNMKILGHAEGDSTNLAAFPYEIVLSNIQRLLDEFCSGTCVDLQNCLSICFGSAGASTGTNAKLLEKIFRNIGYTGKLSIMNDAELILLSETKGEPGAIIISGTGSVGYAVNKQGAAFRAGGWGHIIDDGGSGYRIGMDAIKAALMDFDRRGEKTLLTKMIIDFFDCSAPDELTGCIYGSEFNKAKIAEIAMLVKDAAKQGDTVAALIERQAANDLSALARALINRAELDTHKIVLSGSVILHNENIRSIFENEFRKDFPELQIVQACEKAEISAAYLAMKEALLNV